ncbi:MAG TPA: SurA N-terminal domain-containing protein, partial [Candidatus Acidoferrales bacterium]|nr:SurA N-terminal domain-containing protein [Candidatus Acidoferrales bacterium]
MWDALREKKIGVRIMLGILLGFLCIGMLLYLVPQGTNDLTGSENVADVGGQPISVIDVQNQLNKLTHGTPLPPGAQPYYLQQALEQLVDEKMFALEATRM